MMRLFDPGYTIGEYRSHLFQVLGLVEPLEHIVAETALANGLTIPLNRSTHLREDLCAMGATPAQIDEAPRCSWIPPIMPAGLLGYTYVLLGSMLGGRLIVRQLRPVLGPSASFCFYSNGRGRPESHWASFCSDLDANGKQNIDAICATAVGVFNLYEQWFSRPHDLARRN